MGLGGCGDGARPGDDASPSPGRPDGVAPLEDLVAIARMPAWPEAIAAAEMDVDTITHLDRWGPRGDDVEHEASKIVRDAGWRISAQFVGPDGVGTLFHAYGSRKGHAVTIGQRIDGSAGLARIVPAPTLVAELVRGLGLAPRWTLPISRGAHPGVVELRTEEFDARLKSVDVPAPDGTDQLRRLWRAPWSVGTIRSSQRKGTPLPVISAAGVGTLTPYRSSAGVRLQALPSRQYLESLLAVIRQVH